MESEEEDKPSLKRVVEMLKERHKFRFR